MAEAVSPAMPRTLPIASVVRVRALEGELGGLRGDVVKLQAEVEREQALAKDKLAVVEQLNERYAGAFKALCSDALQANNESFLTLAKQTFAGVQAEAKGDLDKRQEAITQIVAPVAETLKKVEAAGFEEVILYFNVGLKPHVQVKEEMDRFMREVAPQFKGKHRQAA